MASYEEKFVASLTRVFGDAVNVTADHGIIIVSLPDDSARLSMAIDSFNVDKRKPIDPNVVLRWIENAVTKERRLIHCAYNDKAIAGANKLLTAMGY